MCVTVCAAPRLPRVRPVMEGRPFFQTVPRRLAMDETRMSVLMRARNQQDPEAFGEFFGIYAPLLTTFVRSRGVSEHDSDDVVQELLLKLWRRLPTLQFDPQRGRFRSYLWRAALNEIADWHRRNSRHQHQDLDADSRIRELEQDSLPDPDAEFEEALRRRIVEIALERLENELKPDAWQKFSRHYLEGIDARTVAKEHNCTPNVVFVTVSRVRQKLKALCAELKQELDP